MKNCLVIVVGQRRLVSQFHLFWIARILETEFDWEISTKELQLMMQLIYRFMTDDNDMCYKDTCIELQLNMSDNLE